MEEAFNHQALQIQTLHDQLASVRDLHAAEIANLKSEFAAIQAKANIASDSPISLSDRTQLSIARHSLACPSLRAEVLALGSSG